jgi:hypothetical protein
MHMGRKQAGIAAAILVFLHAGCAGAETNSPAKYPPPRCKAPEFEVLPQAEDPKTNDQAKASLYDYEVRQYNREVEAYGACMRGYIAKAKGDAARIQQDADAQVKRITDSAHASIATIQAQIRKATADARKISGTPPSALVGKP